MSEPQGIRIHHLPHHAQGRQRFIDEPPGGGYIRSLQHLGDQFVNALAGDV